VLSAACSGSDSTGPNIVEHVEITGAQSIQAGQTVQLNGRVLDQNNNVVTGRTLTWSSSNTGIATVNPSTGLVSGVGPGTATITARSGNVSNTVDIPVTASLSITGVAPAVLRAGENGTVTGTGFSADVLSNSVTISGERVSITSSTNTSITFSIPANICLPTGPAEVRVTVAGQQTSPFGHPFESTSSPTTIPLGQQVVITNPANFCVRLAASSSNEAYVVGVQSIAEDVTQVTSVRVNGAAAAGQASAVLAQRAIEPFAFTTSQVFASARAQYRARHRAAEMQMRLNERQWLRGRSLPHYLAAQPGLASASIPSTVAVGDTINIRVPKRANNCTQFTEIRAVVRLIGQRGVWLDDVANPANGLTLADVQAASTQLDQDIHPTITAHFGNLSDLDNNGGRVAMVITKEVNRDGEALGVVAPADFFPRTGSNSCPSSNVGETMYIRAADPTGIHGTAFSAQVAREELFITVAHELVHVIQFGRRVTNPNATTFAEVWELEGQALIGEETIGHVLTGRSTGQNYGLDVAFAGTDLSDIEDPYPYYFDKFFDLWAYHGLQWNGNTPDPNIQVSGAPEQCSWLAAEEQGNTGPCQEWRPIYGVPWLLLRWISDQFSSRYGTGEPGLQRALIDHTRDGFETLADVTGTSISELLAQWSASLYVDDCAGRIVSPCGTGVTFNSRLLLPSWNLASINGAGPPRLISTVGLRPRERTFGIFSEEFQVRGGSTAYFRLSGSRPAFTVGARTGNGGTLPGHMQVWIVRVE
jgi:hypothetical protein